MVLVKKAEFFARIAHANQVDKTGQSYFGHVQRVARTAAHLNDIGGQWWPTEFVMSVGYLHDVLEDTDVTADDLRAFMPNVVVDAVITLTRDLDDTYAEFIAKVALVPLAALVKTADLMDNTDPDRQKALAAVDPRKAASLLARYRTALAVLT